MYCCLKVNAFKAELTISLHNYCLELRAWLPSASYQKINSESKVIGLSWGMSTCSFKNHF